MGLIRKDFGRLCIEDRRESFIIHMDDDETWTGPHPEFLHTDLDDLIAALIDLKEAQQ